MLCETPQRIRADVAFADVPMTIDARVEWRARVVEMDSAHVLQADGLFDDRDGRFQAIRFANVITRRERMRSIDAYTERKLWTRTHYRAQMFETMADAFALAGGVLKQNFQFGELQAFASNLQAERANLQRILLRTATRAAGMHNEIINAEGNRPLNFFAKRFDGFQQQDFVSCGEIDQIICMNQDRRDFGLLARLAKESDGFIRQRLRFPATRIAGKELDRIATSFFSDQK